MKKVVSKLAMLSLGLTISLMAIETTQIKPAKAQRLCTSYRVVRPNGLYVYINGGSQIITTLPYNNIVNVNGISADGSWAKIQYLRVDGQMGYGWVAKEFLECYQQ